MKTPKEYVNNLMKVAPRPSDEITAKRVEESVNLKVKWILE